MSDETPLQLGHFVAGEIPDPIEVQFTQGDGVSPLPITDFDIAFIYRVEGGTAHTGTGTGEVIDGAQGTARYTPVAADFAHEGPYEAHLWAGNGTVRRASKRIEYTVEPNLGAVPDI